MVLRGLTDTNDINRCSLSVIWGTDKQVTARSQLPRMDYPSRLLQFYTGTGARYTDFVALSPGFDDYLPSWINKTRRINPKVKSVLG